MAITLEEYKRLRSQGIPPEQIAQQSQGATGFKGFAVGAGKGALSTVQGISRLGAGTINLAQRAGSALGLPTQEAKPIFTEKFEESLQPQTGSEKAGFAVEKIAEFLAPSGALAKGISPTAGIVRRGVGEAVATGGITTAQTGEFGDEAKVSAIVGGLIPVAGAGLKAVRPTGKFRKILGEKIQTSVIKPSQRDVKDGFNIQNLTKYNVGGSLEETIAKTHTEINKRTNRLNKILKRGEGLVNLQDVFTDTIKSLKNKQGKFKEFGNIRANEKAIKDLQAEVNKVAPGDGLVDLVQATFMKRGAGTKSAWAFGQPDREAKALEKIYSQFYLSLKNAIEKSAGKSGGEIKKLNKEISELIPISNASLRRLPVASRNNAISLTDSIGLFASAFDPSALALIGANRLLKSGKFGAFLAKSAEKASKTKEPVTRGAIGQRFLGTN